MNRNELVLQPFMWILHFKMTW